MGEQVLVARPDDLLTHQLLQYRLKYRNADLGTSSKAPRFCLNKAHLAPVSDMAVWGIGVKPPGL